MALKQGQQVIDFQTIPNFKFFMNKLNQFW